MFYQVETHLQFHIILSRQGSPSFISFSYQTEVHHHIHLMFYQVKTHPQFHITLTFQFLILALKLGDSLLRQVKAHPHFLHLFQHLFWVHVLLSVGGFVSCMKVLNLTNLLLQFLLQENSCSVDMFIVMLVTMTMFLFV